MKKILVLDGGGAMGVIQCAFLEALEKRIGRRLSEEFDLIIGSSVGSVIGGAIASNYYAMDWISTMIINNLPTVFKKNAWYKKYKYDRDNVKQLFDVNFPNVYMRQLHTKFICTSVNVVDGKTHFFKSWESKDGELPLYKAIERSFAAPYYFGPIIDEENKAVWLDGGTGIDNSPTLEALIESIRQLWFQNEKVFVLSVGTGSPDLSQSFSEAKKLASFWGGLIRQVIYFMDPDDGGLARKQATQTKCYTLSSLSENLNNFKFYRVDKIVDKKLNTMDGIQYIKEYVDIGKELAVENIDKIMEIMK